MWDNDRASRQFEVYWRLMDAKRGKKGRKGGKGGGKAKGAKAKGKKALSQFVANQLEKL